jgi:hypothetical protein
MNAMFCLGMESAAYLVEKARSVSVLVRGKVPFQNILGLKIGAALKKVKFTYFDRGC